MSVLGGLLVWVALSGAAEHPGLHPLPAIDRHATDADLASLAEVIGDAQIVGLGESLHMCGGYLEAKARIVRWLVEHQGFRLVTIESPWAWSLGAQRYVASGEGSANSAMRSYFSAFWDSESRQMMAWLRQWNVDHPDDRVEFVGFDIQDAPRQLIAELAERGVDPETLDACRSGPCTVDTDDRWILLVADLLNTRRALDQVDERNRDGDRVSHEIRDAGMADALLRLRALTAPGARTVVVGPQRPPRSPR